MGSITFEYRSIIKETGAAFLFESLDSSEEVWIPKSQIVDPPEGDGLFEDDRAGVIDVTEFIADKKGLM